MYCCILCCSSVLQLQIQNLSPRRKSLQVGNLEVGPTMLVPLAFAISGWEYTGKGGQNWQYLDIAPWLIPNFHILTLHSSYSGSPYPVAGLFLQTPEVVHSSYDSPCIVFPRHLFGQMADQWYMGNSHRWARREFPTCM